MSFSSEVKEELNKLSNLANKESVKYEFLGYLATNHVTVEQINKKQKKGARQATSQYQFIFSTENQYNINRFSKLLNNLGLTQYKIQITGKTYSIEAQLPQLEEMNCIKGQVHLNIDLMKNQMGNQEILQKAFIRGTFLGSGSIANPQKNYHLEVTLSGLEESEFALDILESYQIAFRKMKKAQGYSIYAKEGEAISKFLAFIGASHSVLKFEEIRVYRDIRNNVNRKVNCETANLNKTVNSALKQIEAIQSLQKQGKLEQLSEGIQEIARLRLEHPEATLTELGNMLKVPIGKSGVNHRMKVIEKMANEENI